MSILQKHSLFYCNLSFDVAFTQRDLTQYKRAFTEATLYFLFLGNKDDAYILDCEPAPDYYEYLQEAGLEVASPHHTLSLGPDFWGCPWGWNSEASARFTSL